MRGKTWFSFITLGLSISITACGATASLDGRGAQKRKPAPVMGWQGADWLERTSREAEEQPDTLIELFKLQPGEVVADLGCGTGYFARRMVERVAPEGRVYCVDVQPQMLELMREKVPTELADSIVPILATHDDPKLPDGAIDFVLLVDVYHEIQEPQAVLAHLRDALSPRGRVGLVEYRLEGSTARHIRRDHRMSPEQVLAEWTVAGFELDEQIETMPSQHVFIFRVKPPAQEPELGNRTTK